MKYQITRLAEVLASDGTLKALAYAAKLNCLGPYKDVIQKGWAAHCNPTFYRQLGHDPKQLVALGIEGIRQLIAFDQIEATVSN